jgi:hypothetical protein
VKIRPDATIHASSLDLSAGRDTSLQTDFFFWVGLGPAPTPATAYVVVQAAQNPGSASGSATFRRFSSDGAIETFSGLPGPPSSVQVAGTGPLNTAMDLSGRLLVHSPAIGPRAVSFFSATTGTLTFLGELPASAFGAHSDLHLQVILPEISGAFFHVPMFSDIGSNLLHSFLSVAGSVASTGLMNFDLNSALGTTASFSEYRGPWPVLNQDHSAALVQMNERIPTGERLRFLRVNLQ